ncbi:MAG TPA: oligosaccharide flippase family protein [Polyangiales bacterium]
MVVGRILAKAVDFAVLLVLTHLLQPADFGLVAMGSTLVLVVEAILELPLTHALVRLQEPTPAAFDTAFTLSVLRGALLALVVAALAYPMALFYREPRLVSLVMALALGPAVKALLSPRMVLYQRQLDFRWAAGVDVIGKVVAFVAASAVAYGTQSYWAIAVANVTTPLVTVSLSYVIAPYRPRFGLSEWSQFADMMGWHTLSQVSSALNWQMDKFLLGRFTQPVELGRFFMAENVAAIPNSSIIGPVTAPLLAAFAPLRDNPASIKHAYARASSAVLMVGAPPLLGLVVLANPLVRLIFDPKWADAAPIMAMVALANLLPLPAEPMTGLAMSLNKTRWVTVRSALNLAVRLPATLVGAAYFGVPGAIAARALANAMMLGTGVYLAQRLIDFPVHEQVRNLVRPFVALGAFALTLLALAPLLAKLPAGPWLAAGILGASCSATMVYVLTAYLAWNWAGRPPGVEAVAATRLMHVRERLRR